MSEEINNMPHDYNKDMRDLIHDAEQNFANAVKMQQVAEQRRQLGAHREAEVTMKNAMSILDASTAQSSLAAAIGIGILIEQMKPTVNMMGYPLPLKLQDPPNQDG